MHRESGKETFWSQTLMSWTGWTHRKSTLEDSIQKEVITHKRIVTIFIFPIANGKVKLSGGDQVLRTSTLIRDGPERGEKREDLRGE